MRPPTPTLLSKNRYPTLIVLTGLISGTLITSLIWLKLPDLLIAPLSWFSLSLIGLGSFLYLRKLVDPRPRWITVLAALAAVSLVFLFPELFGPACGGMPRAFALNCPKECQVKECTKWVPGPSPQCPNPGSGGGCCLSEITVCDSNCEPPPPPDQPPTISNSLNCSIWGQNGWCIGSSTLELTATEPQGKQVLISGDISGTPFACPAGLGSVSCSVPLPEGAGTANFLATSITGLTDSGSTTFKHDSTLPLINGWLNGVSGTNGWFVSTVSVNASASDPVPGSGLSTLVYNLNSGGWVAYTGPLSLTDGIHNLSLRATDAAGNKIETNQTIKVDVLTPALDLSLTGTTGTNGWYRSTVKVNASISESGSGLGTFEYDLDNAGWTLYTSPLELSDGIHNLEMRVVDVAGNSTTWARGFQVDTINPLLDLGVEGDLATSGWYTSLVRVSLTASDPGSLHSGASGLNALEYNLDGAGWTAYNIPLELSDGIHNLDLRAIDAAGNITTGMQSFQVDTAAPKLDVNVSGTQGVSSWYVSIVQVEAVAGDATSNLSSLEVKVDSGDWSTYKAPLAFGDGQHTYRFRARDNAGHQTLTALQTLQVDTIPPSISLPKLWDVGETVGFILQDNGSGLAGARLVIEDEDERFPKVTWEDTLSSYSFTGEINWDGRFKDKTLAPPGGAYYATVKVRDNAGNESQMAGQIKVPLLSYVDTIFNSSSDLVSGTPESDPFVTFIPDLETDEALIYQPIWEGGASTFRFGGVKNDLEESNEQSALNLGGGNNGAAQPSGGQSFNAGGQSGSPLSSASSNVLWGTTATAAIGAFTAEILRKKREEEAQAIALAAKQESREESSYRQSIKANKLAELKAKWAAAERAEAEQRRQDEINSRLTVKEEFIEAEMLAFLNKPAKPVESNNKNSAQTAYEMYRAGEVAAQTELLQPKDNDESWWANTKRFVQEQIIQPINSYVYQPYVKPAMAMISATTTNASSWVNENVYQPHIKPSLEEAKQTIVENYVWVNEKIYQPFVEPHIERAIQIVNDSIKRVNENIYQPYIKPVIEKTVKVVNESITWVNENIYQPYVQPAVEATLKAISDGIAWTNDKIYQPYIQPLISSVNESLYQPYVKPLLDEIIDTTVSIASWTNQNIYLPIIQPVVSDIDQYIYQPFVKPIEDKATTWWNDTWDKYGEWVHGALDAVGFVPGLGEIADGINGLIYLGEGRYLEAAISAAAMIPLVGDLGKGGKWSVMLGGEVVEELVEKVAKETAEEFVEEAIEIVAEKIVKESGEELIERATKEIGEEIFEESVEKVLKETAEEFVEKSVKESLEVVAERTIKETSEEVLEKVSKGVAEKTTREATDSIATQVVKEKVEVISSVATRKISNTVSEEATEEIVKKVGEETTQFISTLRKTYGDEVVDRFLPFCDKYGLDPSEVLTRPPAEGQSLIGWGLGIDNPANPVNHPLVNLNLTNDEINKILAQSIKNPDSKVVVLGYGGGAAKPYYMLGDEIDGCFLSLSEEAWAPFDHARANFFTDINMPFVEKAIEERKIFVFNVDYDVIVDPLNVERFSLPEVKLIKMESNNYQRIPLGKYDAWIPVELVDSFEDYLPANILGD